MPGMDGFDFVAALSQNEVRLNGSVRRILKKGDLAGSGLACIAAGLTHRPFPIDPDGAVAEEVR